MSKSNEIQDLRGKFEPGDIPTSQDFNKLIDMATNADYTDGGTLSQEYLPKDLTLESVSGDGAGLTNLDANNIASGTISTDLLQHSSEISHGVVKFATEQEIINGDDNVVVSAYDLKDSFAESNQYTDDQMQNIVDFLPQDLSLTSFSGNGSGLTDLNATHITHGQINESRLPSASETAIGAIRIATESQVLNATATDLAVTPATLGRKLTPINEILNDKADRTYVLNQVANLEAGLKFKQDVTLVSDIEVVDEMANGGLIQIDGIQVQESDRVLLTAQTDAQENRVWIAHEMSAWEIAEDFDEDPIGELFIGTSVQVQQGSKYINSIWTVSDITTVSVGHAELTWRKRNDINNYVAGAGITIGDDNTVAVDKDWLEENTLSEDKLDEKIVSISNELSTEFRRLQLEGGGPEVYESVNEGVEYYSPNQHGGFYGTVVRQYFNNLVSGVDINITCSKLIDSRLMLANGGAQYLLVSWLNSSNDIFALPEYMGFRLSDLGKLEFANPNSFTVQSAWVDYVK